MKNNIMRELLDITKALSDETRVRALLALRDGELCLCHVIGLLELAPSTVSKHLDLLVRAGLVERRKEGRWAHFRLAGRAAPPLVRQVLRWVLESLGADGAIARDAKRLGELRCCDPQELVACYKS
jgi:DNA-binding transcriptional ArsR family regulator